jgi:Carboxypeptidase regulatory-like domain
MRLAAVAALFAVPTFAFAQARPVTVNGIAYDSLRRAPLGDAFVTLSGAGGGHSASSDSRGRFHFDSVPSGAYTLSMQHAALESIGVPGVTARVVVTDGSGEITIAVPSFATLWRNACGPGAPPADSGFVYGVVHDASTQKPVAHASVDLSWIDMAMDKEKHITQRRWRSQTRSDGQGSYGVCGVPAGVAVRVQAVGDSAESGVVDLAPSEVRVQRRDLFVAPTSAKAVLRGTIAGVLTGSAGAPFRDARVILDDSVQTRSGADGHFTLRDVPAGTRQVDITAIGMAPTSIIVDVLPNDTARVSAEIKKIATLDAVKVRGLARLSAFYADLAARKKSGFGYIHDSTEIGKVGTIATVFASFPSAQVVRRRGSNFIVTFPAGAGRCTALVWVDGRRSDFEVLAGFYPDELALVEVYPTRTAVPSQFVVPGVACGAIVVWTKYAMK